jgi:hypothetical protein
MTLIRITIALAALSCASALRVSPTTPMPIIKPVKTMPADKALKLRGGSIVPADTYVKVFAGVFGLYALQMLAMPGKMVTDHFEAEATALTNFWIRGESVSLFALCYAVTQLPTDLAVKICTLSSLAIGILYPWNAKFGYLLGSGFPALKYPMHYVPEVLMLVLTAAGFLAM